MLQIRKQPLKQTYRFIREIGRGASGVCFEVVCKATGKKRCAKQISNTSEGFLPKQIECLTILSHPNILRLYEIYQNQNTFYLITDLCQGGDLFDYLQKNGALSEAEAKKIMIQILQPLKYLHQMKICHRDLKPENFLLLDDVSSGGHPNIKMIDFDLAFKWRSNMQEEVLEQEGKNIKGTPYYIAPEVIKSGYNEKCDIWSAGVILHILLSGRAPFDGKNQKEIFQSIKHSKLNLKIPELSDASLLVIDLIKKMLSPQNNRISLEEIFRHPWMKIEPKKIKYKVDFSCIVKYSKFSKMKQIVAGYLASEMTAKQLIKIEPLFKVLDTNKDGFISGQEIEEGLKNFSEGESLKELKNLLNFIEKNGSINFNQFVASFIKQKSLTCEKNIMKVFNMIDCDGNGFIDSEELKSLLARVGAKKKPLRQVRLSQETNNIFVSADKNNDGKIDFVQFKQTVVQGIEF